MLDKNIRISDLQVILDTKYGKGFWVEWEPQTILVDYQCSEPLVGEKIYVLKALNKSLNSVISIPEFLLWTVSICNNHPAEFELVKLPTCLELAWAIDEIKRVGYLTGTPFSASEELIDIVAYLLRLEGFSVPLSPFDFVPPDRLEQGQTPADTKLKKEAIEAYIVHMRSEESKIEDKVEA